MYKKKILRTAHILCKNSILYKNGEENISTKIGCHAFLLQNGKNNYLVDTGIEDVDIANKTKSSKDDWTRSDDEFGIKDNLKRIGIDCTEISKVFLTHAHYDHISGVINFPNAIFYMTKTEYDLLYDEYNKLGAVLSDVKKFLKTKQIVVFDDKLDVEDIHLEKRGGHTLGSMSVEVDGMLFVGDTVFLQDNVTREIPSGFTADRYTSDRLIKVYKEFSGRIITSHDIKESL